MYSLIACTRDELFPSSYLDVLLLSSKSLQSCWCIKNMYMKSYKASQDNL